MPTEIENELEKLKKTNAELLAKTRKQRERIAALEISEASIKAEAATQMETVNARIEKAEEFQRAQLAQKIAKEWFILPKFAEKLVSERVSVKLSESGELTPVILDENGQATKMSVEDLRLEFRGNSELAQVLIGSRASGGGAAGASSGVASYGNVNVRTRAPEKKGRPEFGLR